jgi:uncharacterized protein
MSRCERSDTRALRLGWWLAAGAVLACRKPAPSEIVFTGVAQELPRAGASNPTGGGVPAPPRLPPGSVGSASEGAAGTSGLALSPGAGSPSGGPAAPEAPPAETVCVAPSASSAAFSKAGLIDAAAECATWHYCEFEGRARALETATSAYRDGPSPDTKTQAQQAFVDAMGSWQRAELFRFGPAARSTEPGGQDLRDLIYAWPARSECKVDEQTLSQSYLGPAFHSLDFSASPVTGRTLTALEYLLFESGVQNHCSAYSAVNAGGGWAALAADEIVTRRRAYAAEAAVDLRTRAVELRQAWNPDGGNFKGLLASGSGNPIFKNEQEVLNAINGALFYLDSEFKDIKLATPLGLSPECTATVCPDAVESRYTELSVAYLRENLVGFRRLFQGCGPDYAGIGFDDWLRDAGAGDLAERMLSNLADVDAALAAVPGSLAQALVNNRELPLAIHTATKSVTDELKTDLVTVLNLELPAASEGDND